MKQSTSFFRQQIGTGLALVISVSALIVSIYQANLQKTQQKALVWPYLTVTTSYTNEGFGLVATNNGTGPALVSSMEVSYRDQFMPNLDTLLNLVKPDRTIGYDLIRVSPLNQTVVKAGEEREILRIPWTDETRQMVPELTQIRITLQYCSVLEDCWVFSSQTGKHTPGTFQAKLEYDH